MQDQGVVAGIYTAEEAGATMMSHNAVDLVAGGGIEGDRYATHRGHWSDPKWPDQQLTLFEQEVAYELHLPAAHLRRNIVTMGVELDKLIGREFLIGTAKLRGVRPCDPCHYIETLTRPGMLRALRGRGGLRAEVIESGRIAVGNAIRVCE